MFELAKGLFGSSKRWNGEVWFAFYVMEMSYTQGDEEIVFTIWHYKDSTSLELQAAEKLPTDAERYSSNGIDHYILENSESTTASWIIGTEMYLLAGSVSSTEMKVMIDSFYEG